jgi:hypothetical protein
MCPYPCRDLKRITLSIFSLAMLHAGKLPGKKVAFPIETPAELV